MHKSDTRLRVIIKIHTFLSAKLSLYSKVVLRKILSEPMPTWFI
ncbi:hypothetical protein VCHC43B1_1691 [Vibrio cholerae HC-43B1]|nr:hypothetical protein VCHC43B1_1691 [Vibrio cholerae HC-43B1]